MQYAIWVEMDKRDAIVSKKLAHEWMRWQTKSPLIKIFKNNQLYRVDLGSAHLS
jgi:uncharacterized protein involved in tellurium resistance